MSLKEVRPGDPVRAEQYNALVREIRRLRQQFSRLPHSLFYGSVEEDTGNNATGKALSVLAHDKDASEYVDLTPDGGPFTGNYRNFADRFVGSDGAGIWLRGEWVIAMGDKASGYAVAITDPGPQLAKVTSEISAASADLSTIGSGTVEITAFVGGGVTPSTITTAVRSHSESTFPVDDYVWVRFHRQSKTWWVVPEGGANDGRVKVNVDDDLDFLEDQFTDHGVATFDSTTDVVVRSATEDSAGDKLLKAYSAFDTVSGWNAGQYQVLVNDNGTIKWVTVAVQSLVTNLQVSGLNLQYQSRNVTALAVGAENGWSTWHTGEECP